ncbi:type IX secretion system membrane protein PorP/SprF [Chryseolinea sp. H1M3-3]|uniref:PorP/SprF family type IX secretion system membrane protein n=1 Tax=Chryseolinea sp. H1M3-3 TaxID=3034144 RepID=UPI0023EC978C|nr:type IX secretion system membrane protein PorP/SprF [Chryseolinea sp. H1M3-3]
MIPHFLRTAVILLIVVFPCTAQQKVQFTQYMFNGLVINPAYAGADEALNLTFIQRKQWANIEHSPTTQSLSAHTLFKKKNMGLGFTLINDKIGVHKNLNVLSNFAYHLRVSKNSYLSMGIQAGIHNRKSNYGSLAGNSNIDPKLYDATVSYTAFDLGMGIYYRSPRLHVGFSAPEILPERYSLNDTMEINLREVNFFLFSKYNFEVTEFIDLEPSMLFKFLKGVPLSFDLNLNFIYRKVLTLGLSYRKSESIDFMMKAQVTPQLQFGYAYDHPIGEISKMSNGSHELMVSYVFRYIQSNISSPR